MLAGVETWSCKLSVQTINFCAYAPAALCGLKICVALLVALLDALDLDLPSLQRLVHLPPDHVVPCGTRRPHRRKGENTPATFRCCLHPTSGFSKRHIGLSSRNISRYSTEISIKVFTCAQVVCQVRMQALDVIRLLGGHARDPTVQDLIHLCHMKIVQAQGVSIGPPI